MTTTSLRVSTAATRHPVRAVGPEAARTPSASAVYERHSAAEVRRLAAASAAFGAGLVHLALVADHLLWWAPAGIGIAVLALAQLAWCVLLLRSDAIRLPRLAFGVTLAAVAAWIGLHTGLVPFSPGTVRGVGWSDAAVLLQQFAVLVLLAVELRRGRRRETDARPAGRGLGTGVFLLVFFALVVAVATLTTLGLAASEAGLYAVPHGGHH